MSESGTYDMTVLQGATFVRQFTVTQNAAPLNITGYTVRMHARTHAAATTTILEATNGTDARIVLTTPASGIFTLTLPATLTAALPAGGYVYDLELASTANPAVVTRLLEGEFTVTAEVTR